MKWFSAAYYLFYILAGGFRHYSFDFEYFTTVLSHTTPAPMVVRGAEFILMILAFASMLFPYFKYLHLAFFLLLFALDLFFQNTMSFMSCFVLPHVFPLFLFLIFHFRKQERERQLVLYSAMLYVSVGYLSSFTSKLNSQWYNWSDLVIYSYIIQFYNGFQIPSILSGHLVHFKNHLFWKLIDYSVLLLQLSFVLVFIQKRYFYYISALAVLFHLGILMTLGIGVVFFLYILFYAWAIFASRQHATTSEESKVYNYSSWAIAAVLLVLFSISYGNPRFFNNLLPVKAYVYAEYFYGIICTVIYLLSWRYWKRNQLTSSIQAA